MDGMQSGRLAGWQLDGDSDACTYVISVAVLQCADPEVPENGYRELSSHTVGSTVKYTCYYGYTLNGQETRECLANADNTGAAWSATVPECRSEFFPLCVCFFFAMLQFA